MNEVSLIIYSRTKEKNIVFDNGNNVTIQQKGQ